ncbi:hypothetical protein D9M69_525660 [compost metagenome]
MHRKLWCHGVPQVGLGLPLRLLAQRQVLTREVVIFAKEGHIRGEVQGKFFSETGHIACLQCHLPTVFAKVECIVAVIVTGRHVQVGCNTPVTIFRRVIHEP